MDSVWFQQRLDCCVFFTNWTVSQIVQSVFIGLDIFIFYVDIVLYRNLKGFFSFLSFPGICLSDISLVVQGVWEAIPLNFKQMGILLDHFSKFESIRLYMSFDRYSGWKIFSSTNHLALLNMLFEFLHSRVGQYLLISAQGWNVILGIYMIFLVILQ